ncbi:hypothetical protein HYW67_00950 [Candidatus Parcubacteria bacterium]|nr:hypothetical protein [Candidatus Parcubacteria bacterium]
MFLLATLAFILIIVAAAAAAMAIVWHFLTYRLKGDLGAWLAALCAVGVALLIAASVGAFLAVQWDTLPDLIATLRP